MYLHFLLCLGLVLVSITTLLVECGCYNMSIDKDQLGFFWHWNVIKGFLLLLCVRGRVPVVDGVNFQRKKVNRQAW
jgi:hypothetical protein